MQQWYSSFDVSWMIWMTWMVESCSGMVWACLNHELARPERNQTCGSELIRPPWQMQLEHIGTKMRRCNRKFLAWSGSPSLDDGCSEYPLNSFLTSWDIWKPIRSVIPPRWAEAAIVESVEPCKTSAVSVEKVSTRAWHPWCHIPMPQPPFWASTLPRPMLVCIQSEPPLVPPCCILTYDSWSHALSAIMPALKG